MTIVQVVALFFIAAVFLSLSAYMWYAAVTTSQKHELKKRLRRLAMDYSDRRFPEELRVEILQGMGPMDKLLFGIGPVKRLDRLIEKAGVKADVKVFLLLMAVSAAAAFAVGLIPKRGLWVPTVFALLGSSGPILFLNFRKSSRITKFTEQFPDALDMISRSLKAGHSFSAAMQMVGGEMSEPTAGLFRTAYEEQALGVSTREAVAHMADRIESVDLRFFIMAINIHREIGGNLGEILERLAKTIRERLTIRRQVKVYTAQARLSGYILAVVPVGLAAIFYFLSPGYIEELWAAEAGRYAVAFAIAAQVLGFLVIRKIVSIRI